MNRGKAEIVLIQESADDAAVLAEILQRQHPSRGIARLNDAAEALALIRQSHASLKIVIIDVRVLNAFDILRRIKSDERTRNIPVLIFASPFEKDDLRKAYELGANSFIEKPLESDELAKAVAQLGLYWLSLNKLPPCRDEKA